MYTQENLLKSYVLSEIQFLNEQDILLNEGKIKDWFKSKFEDIAGSTDIMLKCKEYLEKNKNPKDKRSKRLKQNTIKALNKEKSKRERFKIFVIASIMTALLAAKGIENPTDNDLKSVKNVAEQHINSSNKSLSRQHDYHEEVEETTETIKSMSQKEKEAAIQFLFGIDNSNDNNYSSQNNTTQEDTSLNDYFYDLLDQDTKVSDFEKMSPQGFKAFTNQLEKFFQSNAFLMNNHETRNLETLIIKAKASKHCKDDSDEGVFSSNTTFEAIEKDMSSIRSIKATIEQVANVGPNSVDWDDKTEETKEKTINIARKFVNDKIKELSKLKEESSSQGRSSKIYDKWISQAEDLFFDKFNYDLEN